MTKDTSDVDKLCHDFRKMFVSLRDELGKVIVGHTDIVDDAQSEQLAIDIAKKIEEDLDYPGQIKVTIIRETRSVQYAR